MMAETMADKTALYLAELMEEKKVEATAVNSMAKTADKMVEYLALSSAETTVAKTLGTTVHQVV